MRSKCDHSLFAASPSCAPQRYHIPQKHQLCRTTKYLQKPFSNKSACAHNGEELLLGNNPTSGFQRDYKQSKKIHVKNSSYKNQTKSLSMLSRPHQQSHFQDRTMPRHFQAGSGSASHTCSGSCGQGAAGAGAGWHLQALEGQLWRL